MISHSLALPLCPGRALRRWLWLLVLWPLYAGADMAVTPLRPVLTVPSTTTPGMLNQPSAVAGAPDGGFYVLDGVRQRIQVFAANGTWLRTLGTEWHMRSPLGLALDAAGQRLYVADSGNGRVIIADTHGRLLSTLALPREGMARPPDPTDVWLDEQRHLLYVVDNDNHRLLIYDSASLQLRRQVGKMEVGGEGFRWPFSLAGDGSGTVYLVDVINTTVRTLLPDESWRFGVSYGDWGVTKGKLFRPKGVAVDAAGRVYVSDSYLGVIQVFRPDGTFHSVLGDARGEVWRFQAPIRLAFDRKGHLLVVEMVADRIAVFEVGP